MNPKLKEFVQNGVNSLVREQAEKDFRKQLVEDVKEEFDIKAADFNAIVKTAFDKHDARLKRDKIDQNIKNAEELGF